jgi:hypothetical protein
MSNGSFGRIGLIGTLSKDAWWKKKGMPQFT